MTAITLDGLGLSALLYEHRRARQLSQDAVAAALGVNQSTVSRWEAGLQTPGLDDLACLAVLLDIDPATVSYAVSRHIARAMALIEPARDDAAEMTHRGVA